MRLVITADTHVPKRARDLPAALWGAVGEADVVVHAGDWVDEALLDAIEVRASRLIAVYAGLLFCASAAEVASAMTSSAFKAARGARSSGSVAEVASTTSRLRPVHARRRSAAPGRGRSRDQYSPKRLSWASLSFRSALRSRSGRGDGRAACLGPFPPTVRHRDVVVSVPAAPPTN